MERLLRYLALAGTGGLIVSVALTVVDIALRSVSTATVVGIVDIVQLCIMVASMFAIPYGFPTGQHVSIDLFTHRLPARGQRFLDLLSTVLGTLFLAAVFWFSFQQMLVESAYGDRSQTIGIPMTWYWIPFLIGIGISVLTNLYLAARSLVAVVRGNRP